MVAANRSATSRGVRSAGTVRVVLVSCALIALAAGVFLRFYRLDAHGFWADEGISAMHAAGYSEADVLKAFSDAPTVTAAQLLAFERVGSRTPMDTIRALAAEDAQHPPLYYLSLRYWELALGGSVGTMRLLSVLIGLLTLPLAYLLGVELFASRGVGLAAAALVAVSPFHVQFAQYAREYELWAVLTLASSIALLISLRSHSTGAWVMYVILAALGLYSHTFFALVLIGHAAFAFGESRFRLDRTTRTFLLSLATVAVLYLPWIFVLLGHLRGNHGNHASGVSGFAAQATGLEGALYSITSDVGVAFFDLMWASASWWPIWIGVLVLVGWSLTVLIRSAPQKPRTFLLCMLVANASVFIITGRLLSVPARYLVPMLLGIEFAVAFALVQVAEDRAKSKPARLLAVGAMAATLALGVFSLYRDTQNSTWWGGGYGEPMPAVANVIDGVKSPLVIGSQGDFATGMDLSRFVRPDVRFQMAGISTSPPSTSDTVLLLSRYPGLQQSYSRTHRLAALPVQVPERGWELLQDLLHHRHPSTQSAVWLWSIENS